MLEIGSGEAFTARRRLAFVEWLPNAVVSQRGGQGLVQVTGLGRDQSADERAERRSDHGVNGVPRAVQKRDLVGDELAGGQDRGEDEHVVRSNACGTLSSPPYLPARRVTSTVA